MSTNAQPAGNQSGDKKTPPPQRQLQQQPKLSPALQLIHMRQQQAQATCQ